MILVGRKNGVDNLKDPAYAAKLAETTERLKNLMKNDIIPRYIELVLCLEALEHEK